MNKLRLIIHREYMTRIKRKTFLLTTIMAPLGMLLYFAVVAWLFSYQSDDSKVIMVHDKTSAIKSSLKNSDVLEFKFTQKSIEDLRAEFDDLNVDAILYLPEPNIKSEDYTVYYYSRDPLDLASTMSLSGALRSGLSRYKVSELNLDEKILDQLKASVTIDPEPIDVDGKDTSIAAVGLSTMIGTIIGSILFFVVMVYGMMVMRSVMEEKVSRIVEVMISSVRPFQLMMGKIIGVGLVGLTQIALWAIAMPIVLFIAQFFFSRKLDIDQIDMAASGGPDPEALAQQVTEAITLISEMNWWFILPFVILFFLGGYFLYASLYAAVGSAIGEDMGEAQSLTLPISIPLVLSFYIMFMAVQAPNSSLAVFASIFPLFSPLVMPSRLMFNPPIWQVLLSLALLIATIVFIIWLSARIYRVGILMYGKKASVKELAKWIFIKD